MRLKNELDCPICACSFLPDSPGQDKCLSCTKLGLTPQDKNKEDKDTIQSEQRRLDDLKSLIRQIVKEVLEEIATEKKTKKILLPKKCVKCEKEFTPRCPAQKICDECAKKSKNK